MSRKRSTRDQLLSRPFAAGLLLAFVAGCSASSGSDSEDPAQTPGDTTTVENAGGGTTQTEVDTALENVLSVTGSLAIGGLGGFGLTQNDSYIMKATYAEQPEDVCDYDQTGGGYSCPVKEGVPFSLTLFVNGAPACNWLFSVGGNQTGSFLPNADADLGQATCTDGQVEIAETVTETVADAGFREKLLNGAIGNGVQTALFDENGLSVITLAFEDEFSSGPQGPGGPGGPGVPGAGGPGGPGGPNDCFDCGVVTTGPGFPGGPGGPSEQVTLDDCRAIGYTPFEPFDFDDFQGPAGEQDYQYNGPTLYFVERDAADGSKIYDMIVEDEGEDGEEAEPEVFENLKLSGFDDNFSFVGSSARSTEDLKAEITSDIVGDIIRQAQNLENSQGGGEGFHGGGFYFDQRSCDPLQIVNRFNQDIARRPTFDTESIFPDVDGFFGGFPGSDPLASCSASGDDSSSSRIELADFCQETGSDGELVLKTAFGLSDAEAEESAKTICGMWERGVVWGYDTDKKDASGNLVFQCIQESEDPVTLARTRSVVETSVTANVTCDQRNNLQWQDPVAYEQQYGSGTWFYWSNARNNMNIDCSNLRKKGGVDILACAFSREWNIETDSEYTEPYEEFNYPDVWGWGASLTDIEQRLKDNASQGDDFQNQFAKDLIRQIDRCIADMDSLSGQVSRNRDELNKLLTAVDTIANARDANGNLVYVNDTEERFKKFGEFSITTAQLTNLQTVLSLNDAAITGWASSVARLKDTYFLLKEGVQQGADETAPCVVDDFDSQTAFEDVYTEFSLAYQGGTRVRQDSSTAQVDGFEVYQRRANNHKFCQQQDQNIEDIIRFGINAPKQVVDQAERTAGAFLQGGTGGAGGSDQENTQFKVCSIPTGALTYLTFGDLQERATVSEGCESIDERVAAIGKMNRRAYQEVLYDPYTGQSSNVDVLPGTLTASLLLMSRLPKEQCSVTVYSPATDDDGCWIYENDQGQAWGDLLADTNVDRSSLNPSDFSLRFSTQDVPMKNVAERQKMQLLMVPNSVRQNAQAQGASQADVLDDLLNL